jgi:catechol 2,3-dioxygenase-like lactoylglutathione lyase family enzyme
MNEIRNIVETSAYVDDLDSAERFYRDVLGLEVIGREANRHVFFRVGNADVLLVFNASETLKGQAPPPHGASGPGHYAFGIAADALDYWRRRLRDQGVIIETEIAWPRGGHSIYFRDPAGNSVELITPGLWGLRSGW